MREAYHLFHKMNWTQHHIKRIWRLGFGIKYTRKHLQCMKQLKLIQNLQSMYARIPEVLVKTFTELNMVVCDLQKGKKKKKKSHSCFAVCHKRGRMSLRFKPSCYKNQYRTVTQKKNWQVDWSGKTDNCLNSLYVLCVQRNALEKHLYSLFIIWKKSIGDIVLKNKMPRCLKNMQVCLAVLQEH